ncbi:SH3 and multiple ankyrin repeat domains protein 3-like [Oryza brachyantha]|nr:SH3 and multiple ankyrin repeat domains protein 3-like [Oryza brachyantha]
MADSASGPHPLPPASPPPPPDPGGKRQRRPSVRLAGSIPLPSHLPHPRRIPITPSSRSRKPLHLQHPHPSSSPKPSGDQQDDPEEEDGTPSTPASPDVDDLVLAAAFPRKPRSLEAQGESAAAAAASEEVVDVAEWLWGIGMGRYAAAFEAHEVDGEVLPCLTMDDLRDMGIGAVGARRKLYCAIQRLPPPPPPPPPPRR